jgi:prepilin signal peptidase PulO-like enzyme (type II secretory pathway)
VVVFGLFAYKNFSLQPGLQPDWMTLIEFGILFFALNLFFYDALYFLVDRRISFPAIGIALIWAVTQTDPSAYLIGGFIGFGFYWIQWFISKGKWVGAGDQEIGLFMGLVLGWEFLLYGLFLAYIIGCLYALLLKIFGKKIGLGTALPMGAFLIPAMLIMMYDGAWLEQQYWNLFTLPLLF